jgi:hypothetical protein
VSDLHPLPSPRLSRRGLLGAVGTAAGVLALGGGTVAIAAAGTAAEPFRRSAWTPLVGRTVALRAGGRRTRARVTGIDDLGGPGTAVRRACAGREDAFAIVLGVSGRALPEGLLTVEHPVHGALPLFLTGGSNRTAGLRRYVAIVDRRTSA